MTETPTDEMPGFMAEEPEYCHACYRLIQPEQTYYLTVGLAIPCDGCITSADAMRVTDDLVIVIEDGDCLGGTVIPRLRSSRARCDAW